MNNGKSIALVLSSGGSRGLAHIGVISELEKNGYIISSVSGSSIGSIIGGLLAMGKLDDYTKWVNTFNKRDVWALMDFTLTARGLIKGDRVFDKMKTFIPDMNIEDMHIPYAAIASDIINEKTVVFTRGSFYEAIRASIAIPAVFTPVSYNGTILVDGGVLDPIPLKHVARKRGDQLVVVNLYGENKYDYQNRKDIEKSYINDLIKPISSLISTGDKYSLGYYSLLNKTSSAMIKQIAQLNIEMYKPDLVINIPCNSAKTFDFFRAKELIEIGENATRSALQCLHNPKLL